MDALALLCTLHADGPSTLRTLRRAGVGSLTALLALDAQRVAALLESTPAVARRFLREAKALAERAGDGLVPVEGERATPAAPERGPEPAATTGVDAAPVLLGREQRILAEVLASWRRKDEGDPTEAPDEPAGRVEPAPLAEPAPRGLRSIVPGLVDGLDADACERLLAAGVATLSDLARADAAALATATGYGYTRIARWRSLAGRAARSTAPVPRPPAALPASPTSPDSQAPDLLDVAGPFA